jgi:hypothetical protein
MVEDLISTPDGKRDLAALCAFYLQEHKPETTVTLDDEPTPRKPEEAPRKRPRSRRSKSGGGAKSGGGSRGNDRSRPRKR